MTLRRPCFPFDAVASLRGVLLHFTSAYQQQRNMAATDDIQTEQASRPAGRYTIAWPSCGQCTYIGPGSGPNGL